MGQGVTQDKAWQAKLQLENGFLVFEVSLWFLIFFFYVELKEEPNTFLMQIQELAF